MDSASLAVLTQIKNETVPVGTILDSGASVAQNSSWVKCDGRQLLKTAYPALYNALGGAYSPTVTYVNGKPQVQQYSFNLAVNDNLGVWATDTSLPATLHATQAIVTKNRAYILGGHNGSAHVSTVYTAPINADGTLGAWSAGVSLPAILSNSQVIVTNSIVYLLGGFNGSAVSAVYTAPINADGTLGAWTTGTSIPSGLYGSQAIVTKNRVYLLGGDNGSAPISTVYTAPINADGTLGAWTTGTALPSALAYSQAIVTNNRVYLLGGRNGITTINTVYTAPINADGTLGAWTTGTALPSSLAWTQAITTNNRVYLVGGYNGSVAISTVYTAPINADGTLGTWTTGTSLTTALYDHQLLVTNSRVYSLGGDNGTTIFSAVYLDIFLGGLNDYTNSTKIGADTGYFNVPLLLGSGSSIKIIKAK